MNQKEKEKPRIIWEGGVSWIALLIISFFLAGVLLGVWLGNPDAFALFFSELFK